MRRALAILGLAGLLISALLLTRALRRPVAAGPPNLIIISLDSWRADRLSTQYAPKMTAFAAQSTTFTQAYSNGSWTLPAFLALIYGQAPREEQANLERSETPVDRTLPAILEIYGYRIGLSWGDTILSLHPSAARWFGQEPARLDTSGDLSAQLAALPRPWFVWLQDLDLHVTPNTGKVDLDTVYKELRKRLPEDRARQTVIEAYDEGLRDYDAKFPALIQAIREADPTDNTVIVLTSLHGNDLFDHDVVGHGSVFYDSVIQVPLVVSLPGGRGAGRRVADRVQLLDVAPTLLDYAGAPPSAFMEGQSLRGLLEERAEAALQPRPIFTRAHSGASIYAGEWKLVLSTRDCEEGERIPEFGDHEVCGTLLNPLKDPSERHDFQAEAQDVYRPLHDELVKWLAEQGAFRIGRGRGPKDSKREAFERVAKERGYW